MNSGVKICSTDIHTSSIDLDSNKGQMSLQSIKGNNLIEGRKLFSMSLADGVVHVSGGSDSNDI